MEEQRCKTCGEVAKPDEVLVEGEHVGCRAGRRAALKSRSVKP